MLIIVSSIGYLFLYYLSQLIVIFHLNHRLVCHYIQTGLYLKNNTCDDKDIYIAKLHGELFNMYPDRFTMFLLMCVRQSVCTYVCLQMCMCLSIYVHICKRV